MATRGQIAIRKKDGEINSVYSHYDNYITDGNGELLAKQYNDEDEIKQLIYGGNISSLGRNIYETTYYGRDMGRKGEGFDTFRDEEDWIERSNYDYVDYNYLYDVHDNTWYVYSAYRENKDGVKLDSYPLLIALEEKLAKGGKIINNKLVSEYKFAKGGNIKDDNKMAGHKKHAHGGRHRQGYNDRLDESLAMRRGKKRQNFKDRRDESKGAERARLRRAYSSVGTMDRFDSPYRLARGGEARNESMSMLREYDVRSPLGTYAKGGNIDKTDPEYIEYSRLSEKLSAGTITPKEKERLFILAFGEDYIKSKNKGKKRKYDESGKRVKDRDRDEYAKGGRPKKSQRPDIKANKGKLVPSLHPTHKEVLQLMSLPEVEAQEYIIGQKDLIIGQLKDKMQDIYEFAELALQGDRFALEQIESISDHARFNKGGEVYTGGKLSDAGDSKFSFASQKKKPEAVDLIEGMPIKAKGGDIYVGNDLMGGESKFSFASNKGVNKVMDLIEGMPLKAQGGEIFTGSSLSKAGDSKFSYSGNSKSEKTFTGDDVSLAARGRKVEKKKAAKGGELNIGMF